ncbi:DUF5979 domain-containing protein [Isoptericola chiayiensis]|uniref:DUF5979 domain-containing protein n=1 Tax=Isoptericola chiayiensis TaxID=579446 RepID=UPI0031B630DE
MLVVGGDAVFDKAYSVGVVGAGTGVSPAHREDMLIVGGDATVNGATTSVTAFGFDGTTFRTGTIRVGGAQNFQDPTGVANGTFGQLGSVDSANQDPPAQAQQNLLFDDVSVLEDDGYTELFGTEGKMARYSQLCYAELSTDTTATQIVNEGGLLDLEHGTVTSDADGFTLTSDGSGDVVEFQLPATIGSPGQAAEIQIVGVADGATVLINTLDSGQIRQYIGDVSWGATPAEATSNRALALGNAILWNYPFSTDVAVGGATQFPGSILVGEPTSTFQTGFSGTNGRVYTPGGLIHSGTIAQTSGNELHAYPFTGALGCIQALPGTFSVAKDLTGDGADAVPDGTTFTVDWEVTGPAGSPNLGDAGTLDVPADGTAVTGPLDLAEGDEVTISEPTFPDVGGIDWGTPLISPNPVTIGAEGEVVAVTVTNEAVLQRGGFTLTKDVTGDDGASTTEFEVAWTCDAENLDGDSSGTETLTDGEQLTVTGFPVGTVCSFTETTPTDDNGTWAAPVVTPDEITIAEDDGTAQVVTVTNDFAADRGGFAITKTVTGDDGAATTEFTGTWTCDAPNDDGLDTGTWTLTDGDTLTLDGFPLDTTCTVAEDTVDDANGTWDTTIDPGEITVAAGDPTATLVTVANDFSSEIGAFEITKSVTGDGGSSVTEFTVEWTCTTPEDEEIAGSVTVTDGSTSAPVGDLPVGTTCTVSEPEIDDPAGTWSADVSPETLTIGSTDPATVAVVAVTNTFVENPTGGFSITKEVTGDDGAATTEFIGTWTCDAPNTDGDDTGTWTLADGDTLTLDGFPLGTVCTVTEATPDDPDGTWGVSIAPGEIVVSDADPSAAVVTVTNEFRLPSPSPSTPVPTPTPSSPEPTQGPHILPRTGSEILGWVAASGALILVGGLAVLVVRRRQH